MWSKEHGVGYRLLCWPVGMFVRINDNKKPFQKCKIEKIDRQMRYIYLFLDSENRPKGPIALSYAVKSYAIRAQVTCIYTFKVYQLYG
ncbi:hypothetical protein HMPREF2137_08060 [Hoylesella buccalis DNF00853]|uniref:Uncharacterized protein n=1 Tax=Hoylesella buccalis DNF00853 TaxID=1401074 RepID=A0A096BMK2_9BACT|nr:hypothetical protein HMPREF2137_08060 [Hoylesella buccalis DNF00853]KGF42713.1 hypothetical protein HMPREF2140_00990 [Hoylesella buccalis DNF00985]